MAIVLSVVLVAIAVAALDMLKNQGRKIEIIMATFENFQEKIDLIVGATKSISESNENIAADLKRLADAIEVGGISAVKEEELLAVLTTSADGLIEAAAKLKATADINPDPTPEPPIEG